MIVAEVREGYLYTIASLDESTVNAQGKQSAPLTP